MEHCHAGGDWFLDCVKRLAGHLWIKGAGRFVEKHDVGIHGKGTGYGNPLLPSAGKGKAFPTACIKSMRFYFRLRYLSRIC